MVFKIYVAGLYVEKPSHDPATLLATDQIRRVELHMLRSIDRATMTKAIRDGIERNVSKQQLAQLGAAIDQFANALPDMKDKVTPADGVITGVGMIHGRPACVAAYDYTVMAGTMGEVGERGPEFHAEVGAWARERSSPATAAS